MPAGYKQNRVNKLKGHIALNQKYLKKQDYFKARFKKPQKQATSSKTIRSKAISETSPEIWSTIN